MYNKSEMVQKGCGILRQSQVRTYEEKGGGGGGWVGGQLSKLHVHTLPEGYYYDQLIKDHGLLSVLAMYVAIVGKPYSGSGGGEI
jgi:hypothetical protein